MRALQDEQLLKEQVSFASIEQLKLNPVNLAILQDELMHMDQSRSLEIVHKQLNALSEA